MYNRLCIIMYEKYFTVLLYFKRDNISRKTRHFTMNIVHANVLLVVVIVNYNIVPAKVLVVIVEGHGYNEEDIRIK